MSDLPALVLTYLVALGALYLLLGPLARWVLDIPNERSLHDQPKPRTGGIALGAGVTAGWLVLGTPWPLAWNLALLLVFGISLVDDIHRLPVRPRLAAQLLAALIAVWPDWAGLGPFWALVLWLGLVWAMNLYNFMDGADGLAGGMAMFGFAAYAVAATLAGAPESGLWWCVVVASVAFLQFNFPPSRIFLGDAGAIPLGLLAGLGGYWGWRQAWWPGWFPLLCFSPFVVDASLTLLRRTLAGHRPWQAHRDHYYQRLVQSGCGHFRTAAWSYFVMAAAAVSAIGGLFLSPLLAVGLLLFWGLVYGGIIHVIGLRVRASTPRKAS